MNKKIKKITLNINIGLYSQVVLEVDKNIEIDEIQSIIKEIEPLKVVEKKHEFVRNNNNNFNRTPNKNNSRNISMTEEEIQLTFATKNCPNCDTECSFFKKSEPSNGEYGLFTAKWGMCTNSNCSEKPGFRRIQKNKINKY